MVVHAHALLLRQSIFDEALTQNVQNRKSSQVIQYKYFSKMQQSEAKMEKVTSAGDLDAAIEDREISADQSYSNQNVISKTNEHKENITAGGHQLDEAAQSEDSLNSKCKSSEENTEFSMSRTPKHMPDVSREITEQVHRVMGKEYYGNKRIENFWRYKQDLQDTPYSPIPLHIDGEATNFEHVQYSQTIGVSIMEDTFDTSQKSFHTLPEANGENVGSSISGINEPENKSEIPTREFEDVTLAAAGSSGISSQATRTGAILNGINVTENATSRKSSFKIPIVRVNDVIYVDPDDEPVSTGPNKLSQNLTLENSAKDQREENQRIFKNETNGETIMFPTSEHLNELKESALETRQEKMLLTENPPLSASITAVDFNSSTVHEHSRNDVESDGDSSSYLSAEAGGDLDLESSGTLDSNSVSPRPDVDNASSKSDIDAGTISCPPSFATVTYTSDAGRRVSYPRSSSGINPEAQPFVRRETSASDAKAGNSPSLLAVPKASTECCARGGGGGGGCGVAGGGQSTGDYGDGGYGSGGDGDGDGVHGGPSGDGGAEASEGGCAARDTAAGGPVGAGGGQGDSRGQSPDASGGSSGLAGHGDCSGEGGPKDLASASKNINDSFRTGKSQSRPLSALAEPWYPRNYPQALPNNKCHLEKM